MHGLRLGLGALLLTTAIIVADAARALACGCLSPPIPTPESDFAVNQQAEQIIFEVEDGFVTAHVLIQYAGDPEKFGWLVPVPSVPELGLTPSELFGMLDSVTRPQVAERFESICPEQPWLCRRHPDPCPVRFLDAGSADWGGDGASASDDDGGTESREQPVVEVLQRQVIGSYDTVVLGSAGAQEVVDWLNAEGFIVNDEMTPFMQPYLDAGMLFVAAKLLPGSDSDEIRPLRMRYQAQAPMIPLQLTAVAAEPHLTVTSYIYASQDYRPAGHPIVTVSGLSSDRLGRTNYPMALARVIDEAGGDAFVREFAGTPPRSAVQDPGGCCDPERDWCALADDGECSCPGLDWEAVDCAAEEDLVSAALLMAELGQKHARMMRWTTRLSPEEMTFDPAFEIDPSGNLDAAPSRRVVTRPLLNGCEGDVIDGQAFDDIVAIQDCAAVYCAKGRCVATEAGVGCACDPGQVARRFTDLDGRPSITCVPQTPVVDLAAGGLQLPSACTGMPRLTGGDCIDVGGFAAAACELGSGAVDDGGPLPSCSPIVQTDERPGGSDYAAALYELDVCYPEPPSCSSDGWLERRSDSDISRKGVDCPANQPHDSWLTRTAAPSCPQDGGVVSSQLAATTEPRPPATSVPPATAALRKDGKGSGGLCTAGGPARGPLVASLLAMLAPLLLLRRRRGW